MIIIHLRKEEIPLNTPELLHEKLIKEGPLFFFNWISEHPENAHLLDTILEINKKELAATA